MHTRVQTRRDFIQGAASAAGAVAFVGCDLLNHAHAEGAPRRREVVVSGKRVKTVDIHAHCAFPDVNSMLGMKVAPAALNETPRRIAQMDAQGIDVEALSINPFWYKADRDLAEKLIRTQNEKLAELCAAHPDRFVAFATTAMQHPDLAVAQLEYGVKKLGLRGMSVGTHVEGEELSNPKFHPIWAKCEEMGVLVFMHPVAYAPFERRFAGNGGLTNVIGNPLETTIALSHMIFEGTLDRYPKLKLCTSHAGGYIASYGDRSDAGCITFPDRCKAVTLKKKPTEYLKDLYYDTIIFNPEALRYLASRVGVSQIMLGTDYPFPWTRPADAVDLIVNTPGLSDDDKRAMLGGSAAKLLGINI
jgi:aminocarboxymuconate-semialdehyde decarboxylase